MVVTFLPLFVVCSLAIGPGSMDILLLTFFPSAANKDYNPVAIFAEVNPVARTKDNPVLMNTGPDTLGVGQIALLDARQSRRHLGCCLPVQTVRPSGKRAASTPVEVFAYFDHN
jgi:hypothetical protein